MVSFSLLIVLLLILNLASTNLTPSSEEIKLPRRHDYKHTFKKPYSYNKTVPFFDTFGKTLLAPEFIRLAPSVPDQWGSIWAQLPNEFKEWEVEMSFRTYGNFYVGGRGIAFWYTKERGEEGPVLGNRDQWNGLGVFFESADVTRNRTHPLIMAHLNDGTVAYTSLAAPETRSLSGCYRQFRNAPQPIYARISYYNKTLKVAIDANNHGQHYHDCFEANNVEVPTGYYFGLSASAEGETPDDHDILTFTVYEVNPSEKDPTHEKQDSESVPSQEYEIPEDVKKRIEEEVKEVDHAQEIKEREDPRGLNFIQGMQSQILETLEALLDRVDLFSGSTQDYQKQNSFPHVAPKSDGSGLQLVVQKLDTVAESLESLGTRLGYLESQSEVKKLQEEVNKLLLRIDALDNRIMGQHFQTQQVLKDATIIERKTTSKWWWLMYTFLLALVFFCGYTVYQTRNDIRQKKFI